MSLRKINKQTTDWEKYLQNMYSIAYAFIENI